MHNSMAHLKPFYFLNLFYLFIAMVIFGAAIFLQGLCRQNRTPKAIEASFQQQTKNALRRNCKHHPAENKKKDYIDMCILNTLQIKYLSMSHPQQTVRLMKLFSSGGDRMSQPMVCKCKHSQEITDIGLTQFLNVFFDERMI